MGIKAALGALLYKELRHSRGYFLITAILLTYVPVMKSLYYWLRGGKDAQTWSGQLSFIIQFNQLGSLSGPPPDQNNLFYILGIAAALLLGAILLGEERKNSLTYLLTTPASRVAVIFSKFLAGAATIMGSMAVNTLFIAAVSGPLGMEITTNELLRWGLINTLGLLALFTLGLLGSVLAASVLPAATVGFLLVYLPGMLIAMLENIAARYFLAPEMVSIKAQYLSRYLTVIDYLSGEHWFVIQGVDHHSGWRMYGVSGVSGPAPDLLLESLLLLLGISILLGIAILVFERLQWRNRAGSLPAPPSAGGSLLFSVC
jgi:ABC-type transport system involved in multi-copper enzyme maturation permease subunit